MTWHWGRFFLIAATIVSIQFYLQRRFSKASTGTHSDELVGNATDVHHHDSSSANGQEVPTVMDFNSNYTGPRRIFEAWNFSSYRFPCVPSETDWKKMEVLRSPTREGLLFVKNMKTASSTTSGVVIRIARNVARRDFNQSMCKARFDHTRASSLDYINRDKSRSFLLSFVRDPTKRALSQFFHFEVSRNKLEPTIRNLRKTIRERPRLFSNYMLWDMSTTNHYLSRIGRKEQQPPDYDRLVQTALNDYDFIGVTERLDESLVVLKMLLNLTFNDILYLSAKRNGGFDGGGSEHGCVYIVPTFTTPGMQKYFASDAWHELNQGDFLLHQAVNFSLDLTIEKLGRKRVERQVAQFKRQLQQAQEKCMKSAIFPCSPDGRKQNSTCLWSDAGCGYKCLDRIR